MNTSFFRMLVLDVVFDPLNITNEKISYYASLGLQNYKDSIYTLPRNTIIGKKILDETNTSFNPVMLFFPFFPPHLSMPCMPGEHMWAFIEQGRRTSPTHGYWVCRITENLHVDDLNHTHPPRKFEPSFKKSKKEKIPGGPVVEEVFDFSNGIVEIDNDGNRYTKQGTEFASINGINDEELYKTLVNKDPGQINSSRLIPAASVPRYKKRPGDLVLEGVNNSLIVLGTDRKDKAADYTNVVVNYTDQTETYDAPIFPKQDLPYGSIDIVAGRGKDPKTAGESVNNTLNLSELNKIPETSAKYPSEGDPDLKSDASRIRISEKTNTDKNLGIDSFNQLNFSISDSDDGDPAITIKTDKIRIIARQDVEMMVAMDDTDPEKYAAVVLKTDGSIVFKPSKNGYIKLGGDDADRAIICTDYPAIQTEGTVSAVGPNNKVMMTSDLSTFGNGDIPGQGQVATKILVK